MALDIAYCLDIDYGDGEYTGHEQERCVLSRNRL